EPLRNSRTGVYVGISTSEYARNRTMAQADAWSGTGNLLSLAAGRIASILGLQGPAMAVDTACSSGLVAVHLAMQSLRSGESHLALAGGVHLLLSAESTVVAARLRALSPRGRCHSFSAEADGYVRGEGGGFLLLKRLSAAQADGDNILAVLKGSAVGHDGPSNGLTAPNGLAQQQVIRDALQDAGWEAASVAYVEAHGTGTPLGDPIELNALRAVFPGPLGVGSVKSNLGHLEAAAGIAGLQKVILSLQKDQLPASLHCERPTTAVPWDRLAVVRRLQPWREGPRRAGVSAFGLSGTNAHVLVEAGSPRELPRATVPFVRRPCWWEPALAGQPVPGPAPQQRVELSLSGWPLLAEHRIHGEVVVPAAFFVSVLVAVARERLGLVQGQVEDVLFLRPLVLGAPTELFVGIEEEKGSWKLRICSPEGSGWRELVRGRCRAAGPQRVGMWRLDAAAMPLDLGPFYRGLEEAAVIWGPGWRRVERAFHVSDETVVQITNPEGPAVPLHPVLLDNAFGAALARGLMEGEGWGEAPFLPFSLGRLRWSGAVGSRAWSRSVPQAVGSESTTVNLEIYEEEGQVRIEVEGLAFKRARRSAFLGEEEVAPLPPAPLGEAKAASPSPEKSPPLLDISALVQQAVTEVLGLNSPAPADRPLRDLGMDSLMAIELRTALADGTGLKLPATLAFDHPTLGELVHFLKHQLLPQADEAPAAVPPVRAPVVLPATPHNAAAAEPIAIVSMACRFPGGANSPEEFWELLRAGRDSITEIPPERWDAARYYSGSLGQTGSLYCTRAGLIDQDVQTFDASFFGIRAREARQMDPQQRLLLELVWESLGRAGIDPASLSGSRTGVFLGMSSNDYVHRQLHDHGTDWIDAYTATGNAPSIAAGRISYLLGLQGPSLSLDTACSSALVALHLACQSLRAGECDMAIVGGVNLILSPLVSLYFSQLNALSSDGICRSFDAAADGYVRGEGAGVVLLRRQELVGDLPIQGWIRGSAVGQDGRSNGLTAPSGPAQERVIRAALQQAGLSPAELGYVETHGTGTPLGDPIEAATLSRVFGEAHPKFPIGSVKTNLGHLEAAAGMAGLIKLILSLQQGSLPPHLHFKNPNPAIPWEHLRVPTTLEPWPGPRRAGLSAFGFAGTNSHVVVEAPAEPPPPPLPLRPWQRQRYWAEHPPRRQTAGIRETIKRGSNV
ncbi:MAG TPA: beta-ketoacyl synthase N-terminal-like domain-containing protein, partial [Myxococcota bacterium]|nr:beta-ketoacyl synthase N-terminal-like domain-containing protein [Myxococcota bacterium]